MNANTASQSRSGLKFYTSLVFILCLSLTSEVIAGAWTAKEGASYNKFAFNYFFSDENFDSDGNRVSAGSDFTDVNLTVYVEYGIRDNVTAFFSVPYKWIETELDGGGGSETNGIGDQDIGLRYNFFNDDSGVLSIQGLIKIPDPLDENPGDLPLGNGQTDYEIRLLYGKSLYPIPIYFGLEGGYRFRTQDPSDEYRYLAEIGWTITDKYYARTKLDGTLSADNADPVIIPPGTIGGPGTVNPTLAPAFDLGKLELTGGYKIDKRYSAEFTWTPNIYGQNTAAGNNIQFAIIMALP